jgi:hypothetical protein
MDGQSKKLTKLHLLQIYMSASNNQIVHICQVFIPYYKHGILNKIIIIPNLKSKQIKMIEKCIL